MKLAFAVLAACASAAFAGDITLTNTFSDKTAESITVNSTVTGSGLEVNSGSITLGTNNMTTSGTVASDATVITPNVNIGNGGEWSISLTMNLQPTETFSLDSVVMDIVMFNASGDPQGNNTNRGMTLTLSLKQGGSEIGTASYTNTYSGNVNISDGFIPTEAIALTGDALTGLIAGDYTLDVTCNGGTGGGCFFGVKSITFNGSSSVPEPATATLSLLALAGLAARRRRK